MSSEHWNLVERIFHEASQQPDAIRADFVAAACGSDIDVREDVTSLLIAEARAQDFLRAPALDVFARQISREGWTLQAGDRIASYVLEHRLGFGGMGEVWRARDSRLERDVAIKVLLPNHANAAERMRVLQEEARAAGTLNHPNVLIVHDVGEHDGAPYLVTECLDGEALRTRLTAGPLPIDEALNIAQQVARGLVAAHGRGIVHRDLKPENIFLGTDGRVKILDFGLATSETKSTRPRTPERLIAGSPRYMAPEQMRGEDVDARADIYAFGAVLYEMLAGRQLPMIGSATHAPAAFELPTHVSPALAHIVKRCLATSRDDRFARSADLVLALDDEVRVRNSAPAGGFGELLRRPLVIAILVLAIVAVAGAGWWRAALSRTEWAQTVAAPEIQRLAAQSDYTAAFLRAREALTRVQDDAQIRQLHVDVSIPVRITTDPPDAEVAFMSYEASAQDWVPLGRTPLADVRIPRTLIRLRVTKPGFASIEGTVNAPGVHFRLDPVADVPTGMVRVVGGLSPVSPPVSPLDDYFIDRFEVTNKEFQAFVDRGGYRRKDFWREPFVESGHLLSWEDGIARFHDATGQPGPATWQSGRYPDGQADYPVGGVSWYEAAAYAAFVGKDLPTVFHWFRAAGIGRFANMLTVSNFSGSIATVGSYHGLGPFGTYDMAGNVKEWCSNATTGGRFLLGGAATEPRYVFGDYDARSAFGREPTFGIRLAKYAQPLPPALLAPVKIEGFGRDARNQKPVSDEIFEIYRRQYAYDRTPLNAVVESSEETTLGLKQTVAFDAGYAPERMRAFLFLPRRARAPFQTVVFFPATDAFRLRSMRDMSFSWVDFLVRSGRAVLYPVYKGTYERGPVVSVRGNAGRELRIAWTRDARRALDYLETRSDIDADRLAFYGVSAGGDAGVLVTALEPRLRASVLQATGIWTDWDPEFDLVNFAPRVRIPTLMLNGRYDFENSVELSQAPLFALLGTSPKDKRHTVLETGHAIPIQDVSREILGWFDRYLGPLPDDSARAAAAGDASAQRGTRPIEQR
jgi:eukaryotic-like serine/threonine-protein kinase